MQWSVIVKNQALEKEELLSLEQKTGQNEMVLAPC